MEEAKIIDARNNGFSIGQKAAVSKDRTETEIHKLVYRICSITGADLPPTETYATIVAEEFLIFLLNFGFEDLNLEEMLLAFRLNAKGTKYPIGLEVDRINLKGSVFNIDSAAKVLVNYMSFRNQLDRKFQNKIDGYE